MKLHAWIVLVLIAAGAHAEPFNKFDYVMEKQISFNRLDHPTLWWNGASLLRVNLDLSLDGGVTWPHRIATGINAKRGNNIYTYSIRVTPDLWTEHAKLSARTLWSSTATNLIFNEGTESGEFTIAGVRILSPQPGAVLTVPGFHELQWREAGAPQVSVGLSTNGVDYDLIALVDSPSITNSLMLPVVNYTPGPIWICVQAFSNLFDTVQCQLAPL